MKKTSLLGAVPNWIGNLVNGLITNFVRVNVLINGNLRRVTTGDDHEEAGTADARPLELALRFRMGHRRQQRLVLVSGGNRRIFHAKFKDDLRLGADRLKASRLFEQVGRIHIRAS